MRKGFVVAAAVAVVLAGAAAAAVPLIEHHAAQQIKADIERDGTAKVGTVEVGLFDRKIVMSDLHTKQAGEVTIGRWEASGLAWPLSELIEGRTPLSGLKLGDPLEAKHVEVHDMQIVDKDVQWSIASVIGDNLRLDRYEPVVGEGQVTALSMRILKAMSVGRLEQKQLVFTNPANGDKVTIANLTVGGLDKGLFGSIDMNSLEVVPKAAREPAFSMADLKLKGFNLRRPVSALASPAWRPGMPIGRVDLESASLTGFGGEGLTRYGISLGSITQETLHEAVNVKRSRMRIDGFVLAPPASNREGLQLRIALLAMGLKELRLALDCAGIEDRARNEVSIDRCALNGPDLGELTLSLRLVRADEAFWKAIDEGDSFAMARTKAGLAGAKLVLADRGLLERSLKAVATTSGQAPAAVRTAFAQEVRRYQPPGILITDDLTKLLDTVARFVETGGTITLEAKPEAPIGLDKIEYFRRPGPDLVNMLGLSAMLSKER